MESQLNEINSIILTLIKCKSERVQQVDGKRIKYTLENDNAVLSLLELLYSTCESQIYEYLTPQKTDESEKEIREIIKNIIINVLPILVKKNKQYLKAKSEAGLKYATKYFKLYDDFYALCSYRSLEMFAKYMEWDLTDKDRIFAYNDCFKGFWYFANKMILDGTIKNIMKQCPTGYGKSYSDTVLNAFWFGYDVNVDILKVVGNPSMVTDCTVRLIKYMCKPSYSKVFRYYQQFNNDKNQMFSICQVGGKQAPSRILINGSEKAVSFVCMNKDTPYDGGRFKVREYDDITRSKDKSNMNMHDSDWSLFLSQWTLRRYDDEDSYEVFSGTTYSLYDFLSRNRRRLGEDATEKVDKMKYTEINHKTKTVFVKVPKLDFDLDEKGVVTFPQKYTWEQTIQDMNNDPDTFWAMSQQEPRPPVGTPFEYANLQTYEILPPKDDNDCCWAVIDPARTGKNFVSMPIFRKYEGLHYLVDCVFQLRRTEDVLNDFVEKIKKHHITKLHIENNTSTSLKLAISKLCQDYGITYCDITESYTTKKKEEKIANNEACIRNNCVFPKFNLFAAGSDMGKFMKWFTGYSYFVKMDFDDAPDSVAQYAEKFIQDKIRVAKVEVLYRKKN